MSTPKILEDYIPEAEFAAELGCSKRTIKRYRDEPDGLAFALIANKVYIWRPGAREWIARRTRRPNPRRP
jgi:hypothetical protein